MDALFEDAARWRILREVPDVPVVRCRESISRTAPAMESSVTVPVTDTVTDTVTSKSQYHRYCDFEVRILPAAEIDFARPFAFRVYPAQSVKRLPTFAGRDTLS